MSTAAVATAGVIGVSVGAASVVTGGILYSKAYKPARQWWKHHKVSVTVDIQDTDSPNEDTLTAVITAGDDGSNESATDDAEADIYGMNADAAASVSVGSHEAPRGDGFYHIRFEPNRANPLRIKVKGFQDPYFLVQDSKNPAEWRYFRETTLVAKVSASRWSPSITLYDPEEQTVMKRQKRFGLERLELPLSKGQSFRWNRRDKSLHLVSYENGPRNPTIHMPAIGTMRERGALVATNRGQVTTMDLDLTLRTEWDSYLAILGTFIAARLWTRPDHMAMVCDSLTEMGVRWAESCMFFYDMNPISSTPFQS